MAIHIDYYDITELFSAIRDMFCLNKQRVKYEEDLENLILNNYKFSSQNLNKTFDKTQVKKLSEKPLFDYEFKVKYIMPLISIDGLVYLTDERIYMQPFHPQVLHKPVVNIRVDRIHELFKRRYTLMDIGLEIVAAKSSGQRKSMFIVFKNT